MTRPDRMPPATSIAKHSRVHSSITVAQTVTDFKVAVYGETAVVTSVAHLLSNGIDHPVKQVRVWT